MSSSGSNPSSGSLKTWGPPRMVEVKRKAYTSLGLSIIGGKVDGRSPIGIFIKEVLPNSPAYRTGQLFTGDKIVKIGNQSTVSCDLNIAINAIENAGNTIQFVVQSLQTAKGRPELYSTQILPSRINEFENSVITSSFDDINVDQQFNQNTKRKKKRVIEERDDEEIENSTKSKTKATATGGALGFGLFSSNCEQLVTLIKKWDYMNKLLLLKFGLVISSMILQVFLMIIMAYTGNSTNQRKKRKSCASRLSFLGMVIGGLISLINVFVLSIGTVELEQNANHPLFNNSSDKF